MKYLDKSYAARIDIKDLERLLKVNTYLDKPQMFKSIIHELIYAAYVKPIRMRDYFKDWEIK